MLCCCVICFMFVVCRLLSCLIRALFVVRLSCSLLVVCCLAIVACCLPIVVCVIC